MSPIHDQTYRHYEGNRQPPGRAWTVILWSGVREMLGRKPFLGLLILAWVPFLVRAVQIYAVEALPQAREVIPVNVKMFRDFVEFQNLFAYFITVYVGAGLIANDRRANALQVYLSKPLLRMEYIGGKLGVLMFYLFEVTLVPGLLLIVMEMVLSGSTTFVRENPYVIPAVTLSCLVRVIVSALTMLALSSLSKSTRYVAVMYTGLIFFSEALYGVLAFVTGSTRVAWASVTANFDVVNDAIFKQPARYETPLALAALVLIGLIVVSISVLERRVRGVEVVA